MWPVSRGQRRDRDWDVDRGYYGGGGDLGLFDFGLGDIDREMRRMHRQMRRLERDLLGSDLGWGVPSIGYQQQQLPALGFGGVGGGALANIGSLVDRNFAILPNIVEQGGQKLLQYQIDTSGFKPEDINIKTTGDKLIVSGKHEEKSEDFGRFREFRRIVTLPQGANVENMKSRLNPDGLLTIETPFQPPAIEQGGQQQQGRELPIHHERGGQQAIGQQQGGQEHQGQQQFHQGQQQQHQQMDQKGGRQDQEHGQGQEGRQVAA